MTGSEQSADTPSEATHIVGIGASAGGLIALEQFFKQVPLKTGLCFVVIQHLPADHKSMMVELLARHTELPIFIIEENMTAEPNCVYLIPPGKNIKIFHNKFLLSNPDDPYRQLNLPIDIFFESLADDQEKKSIAVILSGTGSDGTRGIRHIKEKFGIAIAQQLETAQFQGMPQSAIETGIVDFILPPERMVQQILSYIRHPFIQKETSQPLIIADETGLTRIFSLLREHHLVDFTFYKQATVLRRIERRMTINQIHELQDYIRFLESYPKEITTLYNELLIGVTSFFRDIEAFNFLRENVLPDLFKENKDREIRFWVEGCSSGEEAYSLAILAHECMETMGLKVKVKVFASDVDKRAILSASTGQYPESITADLTPKQLTKYFYRRESYYQISRQIREMVVFAQHNILKDPPFTKIDLVSCRNLLIYLQPVLQKRALEKFNFALNPGGTLFLGSSESIGEMNVYFDSLNHKWKIFRSKGRRTPVIGSQDRYIPYQYEHTPVRQRYKDSNPLSNEKIQNSLLEVLAQRYVELTILVNEENEILHVLGNTEKFLRFPAGKPINNIFKVLVKEMVVPITAGLHKVFKDKEPVKYSNIHIQGDNSVTTAKMEIHPMFKNPGNQIFAVIFIENVKKHTSDSKKTPIKEIDIHVEKRIERLENELQFTRESLQTTIEELETSNEELGATNEELMASNEELQSTNEELQSVNEELYTVNAEYQGKNIELIEIKNDFENLFNSLQLPVMFLDENLEIRQLTPQLSKIFRVSEKDIGRPVNHLIHHFINVDLVAVFEQVVKKERPVEQEICNNRNEYYLMRAFPYQISSDFSSGVVVIFIDISQRKKNENKLHHLAAVVMDSNDAIVEQDFDGNIMAWNKGAEKIYGYTEKEALTMNIGKLIPEELSGSAQVYIRSVQEGKEPDIQKTKRITKGGDRIDIALKATRLEDEFGNPVAVVTTERDVTGLPEECIF